eukprot:CAMPEP_0181392690 /NCGR_PEP_ID=MMETSP1106-20121128/26731_1 /TAXON_ID=81844 /ORGANISM="Mantoniella antarctica, Strain SL-175" /LENGTH=43 /DNA_ID= /DNA_START= /DNA_END= /DNA_ORIENTATION=
MAAAASLLSLCMCGLIREIQVTSAAVARYRRRRDSRAALRPSS